MLSLRGLLRSRPEFGPQQCQRASKLRLTSHKVDLQCIGVAKTWSKCDLGRPEVDLCRLGRKQLSSRFSSLHARITGQCRLIRSYHAYEASIPLDLAPKLKAAVEEEEKAGRSLILRNASREYISLTSNERKLFALLKRVVGEEAELRVAGGWVRDKLLGLASEDIDISVDTISGVALSHKLESHLHTLDPELLKEIIYSPSELSTEEINVKDSPALKSSFTKLNPSQSKHLETAIITLYGIELNFAQLRTDVYGTESRIPQIKFGSSVGPSEDSFRRDFTINALFYNIMTDSIEDYTGRSILDLGDRVINTPLPPIETLKDDPLRALRAVRFAARFGFSLGNSLKMAISDPHVHQMLLTKVTAPRIGIEVQKMFSPSLPHLTPHNPALFQSLATFPIVQHNNPLSAIDLMVSSRLHAPIFNTSSWLLQGQHTQWTDNMASHGRDLCYYWHHIYNTIDAPRWEDLQVRPTPHLRSALFALIFLTPLLGSTYKEVKRNSIRGKYPWVETFKHSLQYPLTHIFFGAHAIADSLSITDILEDMLSDSPPIQGLTEAKGETLIQLYASAFSSAIIKENHRERLGMWLRTSTPFWRSQIIFSRPVNAPWNSLSAPQQVPSDWIQSNFEKELGLIKAIEENDFEQVRSFRPFLNGHQIGQLLHLKPGPTLGEALKRQLSHQIIHRSATEEQVKQMLLNAFPPRPKSL